MEFEDGNDHQEDDQLGLPASYTSSRVKTSNSAGAEQASLPTAGAQSSIKARYRECLKNHAVGIGGHAVDGCGEFMAAGVEGTMDALKCAACNCHRNFHRKETMESPPEMIFGHPHHLQVCQFAGPPYYRTPPGGYLQVAPQQQRPLALTSCRDDLDDISDPSGGGFGGDGCGSSRKRFRTKFTQEQKDRMLELAERLEWRIQKQDEGVVQQFCHETGVKRHVLKVWMHNNKHTLGKKP